MNRSSLILIMLLGYFGSFAQNTFTISGTIKEQTSQELLPGVSVYDSDKKIGTVTNKYGFYSLTLPADTYNITYSFVGYVVIQMKMDLTKDIEQDILLVPNSGQIGEVTISAKKNAVNESEKVQMSSIEVPIKQIKDIPSLLGEKDVLKVLQLMPGVQSGSEGQSGIYVRGGGPDQNLIILDDAVVYNASHLFGFFSLFNGDALKSVELIKGGFPARYGGRLSSVIDMSMKEGNRDHYAGEFGVGLISARGVFEGPIPGTKKKGSFIVAVRRTYIDALARPLILASTDGDELFGYFFQDFNAKLNYDLGKNDRLYLSGYFGKDKFYFRYKFDDDTEKGNLGWGNQTGTIRWNHKINKKMFSNTSFITSNFRLGINASSEEDNKQIFELDFGSSIRDYTLKYDLDFYPNVKHEVKAGAVTTFHKFKPNAVVIKGEDFPSISNENVNIAMESALYIEDTYTPYKKLKINGGMRFSHFYQNKENYFNPEPRLAAAYTIRPRLSAKASFAQMNQYVHLLSNTGIGLPTDLWVPATSRVKPQRSTQYAAGLAQDFKKGNFSLTLEGYYKTMHNILSYREGASFLEPEIDGGQVSFADWQDKVTSGEGTSYGVELFLQRKYGDFSGWIGYTLSWTQLQFDELNNGKAFWAKYDRRHDISVVGIYKINKRIKLSATWVYGTGNAISLATTRYQGVVNTQYGVVDILNNYNIYNYGEKNSYRMRPYHRLDVGLQMTKEKSERFSRTWEFSVYNAYSRSNPFFLVSQTEDPDDDWRTNNSETKLYQISLFPIIPSISYSLTIK